MTGKELFPSKEEYPGDYFPEHGWNSELYVPGLRESILVFLFIGAAAGGIAFLFYNSLLAALFFIPSAIPGRKLYCRWQGERNRWKLREQFRDLLYSLSASISAGHQMEYALCEARENLRLIYDDSAPMIKELRLMVMEIRESRIPADRVLEAFARRSRIEEVCRFSQIYTLCRKTGGDMEGVIGKTVDMLMDTLNLRRERRVLTAQKRMEAVILTLMPILVLLFLRITAFDYLSVMYETALGRVLMSFALAGLLAAGLWSLHLTGDPE